MYIEKDLETYVRETSSKKSAPGGGSVAGLVASLSTALMQMAMNFTIDKKSFKNLDPKIKAELLVSNERLETLMEETLTLVDEDTLAFNSVLLAYKMEEGEEKQRALDLGYKKALSVPLKLASYSLEALEIGSLFSSYASKNLISDVAIGAILAQASLDSSLINVRINLLGIKDEAYKNELEDRLNRLEKESYKYSELIITRAYKDMI